jgi:glycosyltransferase involved in cell wall biosynthesis
MHVGISLLTHVPTRAPSGDTYVRGLLQELGARTGPDRVTALVTPSVALGYSGSATGHVAAHVLPWSGWEHGEARRAAAVARAVVAPRGLPAALAAQLDVLHYPATVPIPASSLPSVVTVHDALHHDFPRSLSRRQRLYRRWAYDGSARSAAVVITPTDYVRKRLSELLALDPDGIEVIHHGIDHSRFSPRRVDDERWLRKLELTRPFLVYPANMWQHKNHSRLLQALSGLPDRDVELVLTGHQYGQLDGLLNLSRRLNLGRRVRHLGVVERNALPVLYRNARAMVFPSLYEGFGFPPLEAMSCECPVTSSTRGALGEICGEAVLPLEPDDVSSMVTALDRISTDSNLRSRLKQEGRRRALLFSWKRAAERHLEVYARAAALGRS